jgi:hypothetical protein
MTNSIRFLQGDYINISLERRIHTVNSFQRRPTSLRIPGFQSYKNYVLGGIISLASSFRIAVVIAVVV